MQRDLRRFRPDGSVPVVLAAFAAVIALTAGPAPAQETSSATVRSVAPARAVAAPAVPVLKARAASGQATGRRTYDPPPPAPPDPLPESQREMALESVGGGGGGGIGSAGDVQAPEPQGLTHAEVNARRLRVGNWARLDLFLPYDVDSDKGHVNFNKNFPGSAALYLNVEEGHTYLLDFSVSSWGSGTYVIETDSGSQEFDDGNAKLEHVVVGISATETGWTRVKLNRTGTGYYLYGVVVDRAN